VPPAHGCPQTGPPSPEVTGAFCRVPSTPFSQAPWYALPVHQCRFGVRSICRRCFLEAVRSRPNPVRDDTLSASSRPGRLGNINPIPIGYGFRPRLRGPANPARIDLAQEPLDLRRKRLSRFLSLLMSAFSLPIPPGALTGLPSQAYGTLRYHSFESAASVHGLSPGTSSAQAGLFRPVSYYAFFKGWLLLSQPPGCFGLPTSFPT
jgi:hypothetical protein